MEKIKLSTTVKKMSSDLYTPVGIYLRLRDKFRDTILLESTDHHTAENSFSFIAINAIGGIEILDQHHMEFKLPGQLPVLQSLSEKVVSSLLWEYMQSFEVGEADKQMKFAQRLFGYTAYDAIPFFETIPFSLKPYGKESNKKEYFETTSQAIPLMRYRLYQYVIAIDHFRDELFLIENHIDGIEGGKQIVENIICSRDLPQFPFELDGGEQSNLIDEEYLALVEKGISHCYRGDVFQIVLSRRFEQKFKGDEFNVYRALRMVNPSPYLFYFDYGEYKLMGSSPESQLIVSNGKAIVHSIAELNVYCLIQRKMLNTLC